MHWGRFNALCQSVQASDSGQSCRLISWFPWKKGEPQKRKAQKVSFKSFNRNLKVTLSDFVAGSLLRFPFFRPVNKGD